MISLALGMGLLALLAAALLAPLGVIGLRERGTKRGALFAALMFCMTGWAAGTGLSLLVGQVYDQLFHIPVLFGMATVPLLWLLLNLVITEHGAWLTWRRALLLAIVPALFLGAALTNPLHQWIAIDLPPTGDNLMTRRIPVALGVAYGIYAVILGLSGGAILLRYALGAPKLRRAHAIVIFSASIIPLLAGAAYTFDGGPWSGLPFTAQTFVISGVMLWFGVLRFHLMSVQPWVHRILFDNLRDGALVVDGWGNLIAANPAALALLDISDDDLLKPFASVIRWPELTLDQAQGEQREIVHTGPTGSEWYEVRRVALPTSRTGRTGSLLQLRNISEARRARQELEESETFYRNMVERQGEGIATLNREERFTYANPAAEAMLGVPAGALIERSIYEFLAPGQGAVLKNAAAHSVSGDPATYELTAVRADGAARILLVTSAPHRLALSQDLFVIFRDVTDAKTAEQRSHQWRQRYESIAAVSGQLVYYHDAQTDAVEWGESVHQVFGYTRAEMTGGIVQWANLLHPADRQRVVVRLATAQVAYEDQYRLQHKLGHYLLIHAHILPLHDETGALTGYVGVLRDISRQHRLQQAVVSHASRLEQLQSLALMLSSQRTPVALRNAIVQSAVRLLNASGAVLYAASPAPQTLRQVAAAPAHLVHLANPHPNYLLAQQVMATQRIQVMHAPPDTTRPAAVGDVPATSATRIGVPLFSGAELTAVLVVEDSQRPTGFSAEDEQIIRLLANQAAVELANSHLLAATTTRAQRLLLVNEITTAVLQVLDLAVVLQYIADGLARVLGIDDTRIAVFDEERQQLTLMAHAGASDAGELPAPPTAAGAIIGNHLLHLVLQTRAPQYIADAAHDPRTADMRDALARRGIGALLVIPVAAGEEVLGVIVAGFPSQQADAGWEDDLRIGQTLANLAAVRIQQVRLYATLQRLAIVDELTQVYNYRALFEIGENEFARAHRNGRPLSAIFIDIDHFREFNKRYSHAIGNQVLRTVGRRLLTLTRTTDLVARFGGEEFVVLLPETDLPLATSIGYRIHEEIGKRHLVTDQGQLSITVSVGVATRTAEMDSLQALIDRANQGEHRAKIAGRDRVVVC